MKKERKKVAVAFSGGVDSSVSAFLLKEKGFDVLAVFMKLFDSGDSEKRARSLAESMNIPFKAIDLRKEFKKKVIDYFISSYEKGLTPNPCVVCNKDIKFGIFLEKMEKMKADFFATGHYAKVINRRGVFHLSRPKDLKKDQSYFLYRLSQKQLSRIIFPLASYNKEEVRSIARKNKIKSVDFLESQEACFIKGSTDDFLKEKLGERKGEIVDKKGNVLGKHKGVHFYTIGQRKGIGLSGGPYFVIKKNVKKNQLIISDNEKDLLSREVFFKNVSWISGEPLLPTRIKAKIRYGQKMASGKLSKISFVFDKPQKSATPGQSIVFYKGSELIGGAIII